MRAFFTTVAAIGLGLLMAMTFACSDDDNPADSNPEPHTPAAMVGTWDWTSAAADGVPVSSFAEVSFTDTSTSQELIFTGDGHWQTYEYYNGSGPVFTRSGTLYDVGDSVYITCTNNNGVPADEDEGAFGWSVVVSTLTLSGTIDVIEDTILVVSTYTKQ